MAAKPKTRSARGRLDPAAVSERTTAGVFFRQAARYGDRPWLHHHDGSGWRPHSWSETQQLVLALAAGLLRAGVQSRDHVLLISENRLEWPLADLAIQSIGAVTVPVYPNSPAPMAQTIAANSEAVLAVASDERQAAKLPPVGKLRSVVLIDHEVQQWLAAPPAPEELEEIERRLGALRPDDVATVIYTSGTTGEPKGVELAHRSFVDTARSVLQVFPLGESDLALSWLPLSHVFERTSLFICLLMGSQTYLSRGIDRLTADITEVRPTLMTSVPRVFEKMQAAVMEKVAAAPIHRRALFSWAMGVGSRFAHAEQPGPLLRAQHRLAERLVLGPLRERLVGGRLRMFVSGGAALAQDVEDFFWSMGVSVLQGWGMTETCSGATSNTPRAHRFRSVGRPFPGVELKIAEDGEILVRGPGNMLGYHHNPEATAEVLKDGWLYTGDIGEIDADGFLRITDRKKDLFKTAGGKYIAPQMLEFQLQQDLLIERAVVVGEGRPYVVALIVPDWEQVRKQVAGEPQQLCSDERVNALIQAAVDRVNAGLGSWETIKYFTVLPEDFREDRGELSLKLSVKRRAVQEHFAEQIEAMYRHRKTD